MKTKITAVYLFPNGMVAAFDDKPEQFPELQGKWSEIKHRFNQIKYDFSTCEWHGFCNDSNKVITGYGWSNEDAF